MLSSEEIDAVEIPTRNRVPQQLLGLEISCSCRFSVSSIELKSRWVPLSSIFKRDIRPVTGLNSEKCARFI
jgi:hypothetical protein